MEETVRVLVFGATGVGKTSLCNSLTGGNRPTDSGALGVTAKCHVYGKFKAGDKWITLVDSVGLHEADSGTVPTEQAAGQLVQLIENSRDGFNLLIHVAKAGRLTKQHQEDYEFFVNRMTERRVPVILVLTGCENELPLSSWPEKNKRHFQQFQYRELVASCFAEGGSLEAHFAPLRIESRQSVLAAIQATALPTPVRFFGAGTGRSVSEYLTKLWNDFAEIAGLPAKYRAQVNESAYQFLRRIGVSKKLADLAIAHFPDLIGDFASKTPIPFSGPVVKTMVQKGLEALLNRRNPS